MQFTKTIQRTHPHFWEKGGYGQKIKNFFPSKKGYKPIQGIKEFSCRLSIDRCKIGHFSGKGKNLSIVVGSDLIDYYLERTKK